MAPRFRTYSKVGEEMSPPKSDADVVLKWWQLIVVIATFCIGLGEARLSLARLSADVAKISEAVEAHVSAPGHPIELERLATVQRDQNASASVLGEINARLARMESNQIRLCQKANAGCQP